MQSKRNLLWCLQKIQIPVDFEILAKIAGDKCHKDILTMYFEHGASLNNAMDVATMCGHEKITDFCLTHGTVPTQHTFDLAVWGGNMAIIKKIKELGKFEVTYQTMAIAADHGNIQAMYQ